MLLATTPWFLLAAGLAGFAAGFVKGFAGFGFAVVFTPVMSLLSHNPRQVVFVALVLGTVMSLGVIAELRHAIARDRTVPLVIGTVIGTPLGIMLLGVIDAATLKLIIAGVAIAVTALRLADVRIAIRSGAGPLAAGAVLGGALNGCTSMGGPVPALIVAWQGRGIDESRSILVVFNLLGYVLAIAIALATGVARARWLASGLWLLPPAGLGTFTGIRAVRRVSPTRFAHVVTGIIGLAGIAGALSAVRL
ncbi:sulfite exporter TauE/SafE family protein [Acidiphilium sp. PA]|uniref:sulfite exporter TauE/SafE family protein n=1 Tax=Acidiphilium sp. PA TaxID=2871705 RepID=UPI0022433407|nr:sulfite exporter TauE/SafE family protein [Acidiphilium sp. PA]MCW8308368.1 sulfite exporter TauE/SafE family protein [Acidiphilium sp. PA]